MSLTFMAKPNQREGNSCHIHFSLRGRDGTPLMSASTACPGPGSTSWPACSPPCAS
jgi:glutamine synthetase